MENRESAKDLIKSIEFAYKQLEKLIELHKKLNVTCHTFNIQRKKCFCLPIENNLIFNDINNWLKILFNHINTKIEIINKCLTLNHTYLNKINVFCADVNNVNNFKYPSILPSSSSKPSHQKMFINDKWSQISVGHVVAIDSECYDQIIKCPVVDNNNKIMKIEKTYKKQPLRIAIVTNLNNKQTLLYHSFWRPFGYFRVCDWLTGLSYKEIKSNYDCFVNSIYAKRILENLLQKHKPILVFAGASLDIKALNLNINFSYRDIQSFYVRYPFSDKAKEPINLKWLSKHVLGFKIQDDHSEKYHSPVTDAVATLKLYNLITENFWNDENSFIYNSDSQWLK